MQRYSPWIASLCGLLILTIASTAAARTPVYQGGYEPLAPGVELASYTREGPVNVWALAIDLCAPGVAVRATTEDEMRQRTSEFGQEVGATAAINGGFYEPDYSPTGFAMGQGRVWAEDIAGHGFVGFGDDGAQIWAPRQKINAIPPGLSEAVGGYDSVVVDGEVPDFHQRFCQERHPRTAVGVSEDGQKVWFAIADGRSEQSRGMTCDELGQWMIELGAWQALNLDGGGSTTLWTAESGLVNRPSGGPERVVSNHLAIIADGQGEPAFCAGDRLSQSADDDSVDEGSADDASNDDGSADDESATDGQSEQDDQKASAAAKPSSSRCGAIHGRRPSPMGAILFAAFGLAMIVFRRRDQRQVAGGHWPEISE